MATDAGLPIGPEELRELLVDMRTALQKLAATSSEQVAEVKRLSAFLGRYNTEFRQITADMARRVQKADRLARVAIGLLLRKGLANEQDIQEVLGEMADEEFARMMRRMLGEPEGE